VSLRPPTLLPSGLPEVSGTRPLLHRPIVTAYDPQLPAPPGRVTGLAVAVAPSTMDVAVVEAPRPELSHPQPRALSAVDRSPRVELVHATDDYVGEPRVPADPHRAPGWLRAISQAPGFDLIPGLPPALAAMPIQPSPRPEPPRPAVSRPAPTVLPSGQPAPRRSGLGPPIVPPVPLGSGGPTPAGVPLTGVSGRTAGRSGTVRARGRGGLGPPLVPAPVDQPPQTGQAPAREPAPHPSERGEPEPAVAVPTEVTQALRAAYGVEVADATVRSGPQAQEAAQQRQARAYTADDQVVLGTQPASDAASRALIAHELVHLVQQRELGPALPDEGTPGGRALEADAVAAEHAVLTGRPLPPLSHRPLGTVPPGVVHPVGGRVQRALTYPETTTSTTGTGSGTQNSGGSEHHDSGTPQVHGSPSSMSSSTSTGSGSPTGSGAQAGSGTGSGSGSDNQPHFWSALGNMADNSMQSVVLAEWGIADPNARPARPLSGPGGRGRQQRDEDPWRLRADSEARWGRLGDVVSHDLGNMLASPWGIDIDQVQHQQSGTGSGTGGGQGGTGQGGATQPGTGGQAGAPAGTVHGPGGMGPAVHTDPSRPLSATGRPQVDTDDLDLDELAGRLYDRLRSRLRMELLLDRERAGMLTDFR
jgi:hypothetical protein